MKLIKALEWDQVEEAATATSKCIRPNGGNNWARAKQTWEIFRNTDDVIYFIAKNQLIATTQPITGYIRLLKVSGFSVSCNNPAYIADFIAPTQYLIPKLAKELLPESAIFCKLFTAQDTAFATTWPKVRINFPALERYPYHQQMVGEGDWKLVI